MFALKVSTVLAAMLAVAHASPATNAPVPSLKGSLHTNDISIMQSCNDPNLTGLCFNWSSTVLPTGCGDFRNTSPSTDDQVSSVSTAAGIKCTLFADPGCKGRSQLIVGTLNDFGPVGFDNTATSFSCSST
ncbi:hypothetical protein C8R43DRAFT_1144250 [Mycena crocata]|nr:hypothetical protein C8R43DRAFT_1144250 [Mycena crocata]